MLFIKKKPLLFLLADLNAGPTPAPTTPPRMIAPPVEPELVLPPLVVDFEQRFDAVFARLDHEHGSHNHVSLVALRRAMPMIAPSSTPSCNNFAAPVAIASACRGPAWYSRRGTRRRHS